MTTEERKTATINNLLVSTQFMLEAIDDAENCKVYAKKVKQSGNRLKADLEKQFHEVFKGVSLNAKEYYLDMIEWNKQQTTVFSKVYEMDESEKVKFLSSLQNFYTMNLKLKK
jgi:hypothetical protein